jgi:hypothetical protein
MREKRVWCYLYKIIGNYAAINFIAIVKEKAICVLYADVPNIIITEKSAHVLSRIKYLHSFHGNDAAIVTGSWNKLMM